MQPVPCRPPRNPQRSGFGCFALFLFVVVAIAAVEFLFTKEIEDAFRWATKRFVEPRMGAPGNAPAVIFDNRTIGDLIVHFRAAGLDGKYKPAVLGLVGTKEAGSYEGIGIDVTIYRFEEMSMAESLEKSGVNSRVCHRNGKFIMVIYKGDKIVPPVFNQF